MNRRTFLASPLAYAGRALAVTRPNIVILLADDLGWADVGFHDSEIQTPNIDRLASQGVRFERFYSFPVCSPTRSALMTARSPMRYGIIYSVVRPWSTYGLPPREHLMPQSFQATGYQTAMTGKWHLGHSYERQLPNSRGFDRSYGHLNGAIDYFTHEREGGLDWHRNGSSLREEGYSTYLIGAEAMRIIKSRDKAKPLFLYVPFNSPHSPLQAPRDVLDKYAGIADRRRRTFAAMVDAMDTTIGKILATLDGEGISRETLVLFFSDNGGPINAGARNTPLRGAKATTFEGGIRVPAVMRWPGRIREGGTVSQVMTAMDVFPTFAAVAGVASRNSLPLDGKNMWPAITGGAVTPREDLFFAVEARSTIYLAVHHREWKLVRQISTSDNSATNLLFNINDDPCEKNDVAAEHTALVKDLVERIEKWRTLHPKDGIRFTSKPPTDWKAPKQWAEAARR
jgi:arylsulfatase B